MPVWADPDRSEVAVLTARGRGVSDTAAANQIHRLKMPETIYRKLKELKKLPNNPRFIKDEGFARLCRSIQDNPDYFEARPLILSDRTGELVIIAGNQRYEAAKHLKLQEAPTCLLPDLTEEREREIVIRDNINNGAFDWDCLANEWSDSPLQDWGLAVPDEWLADEGQKTGSTGSESGGLEYRIVIFCEDEQHQAMLLQKLEAEGLKCQL